MGKKIRRSFIPFLLLLIFIVCGVIYMDYFAAKINSDLAVINVQSDRSFEVTNMLDYSLEMDQEDQFLEDSLYKVAVSEYKSKSYKKAKAQFERVLLQYPDNAKVHNFLGLIDLKEKRFKEAQVKFEKACGLDPTYYGSMLNLGIVYNKLHNLRKAIECYEFASQLQPNKSTAYYNLGLLHLDQEAFTEAKEMFAKSVALTSAKKKAKALCYLGMAYSALNEVDSAKISFEESINYAPSYEMPRVQLALMKKDFSSKEVALKSILKLNKNSYFVHYHLGVLYKEENKLTNAEKFLKRALEINPDDEKILAELSSFLIKNERVEEAIQISEGFSIVDTLPETFFYQAKAASKKAEYTKALKLYDKALIASDENYPEAYVNKAIIYKKKGDVKEAIAHYEKAITYKKNYPKAYYNLGLLYNDNNASSKAIANFKLSIDYDKKAYKSWYSLGTIYEANKKYTKAIDAYKKASLIKPKYLKSKIGLASVLAKKEDNKKAIATYKELLAMYPNYTKGYYNLALLERKEKRYSDAIQSYEKVLALDSENSKARMNLGVLYSKIDQLDKAIATFETAADNDSDNPIIRFNLALQYEKKKDFDNAVTEYNKAVQLKPDYKKALDKMYVLFDITGDSANKFIVDYKRVLLNPDVDQFFALGKKLEEEKQFDYAVKSFKKAKKYGKKGHWAEYWVGKCYLSLNRTKDAQKYFSKALEIKPTHKFSLYRMGQLHESKGRVEQAHKYYNKLLKLDPEFKIKKPSKIAI